MIIDSINTSVWFLLAVIALSVACLSGIHLWTLERQQRVHQLRLEGFRGTVRIDPHAIQQPSLIDYFGNLLAPIVGVVEQQRLRKALLTAGLKDRSVGSFVAIKALAATTSVCLMWLLIEYRDLFGTILLGRAILIGIAFMVGWRLPDFILRNMVKRRRSRLEQGMPDALDLLVICAEAGLSLNQSIGEISKQLRVSNKDVADEFAISAAEMQVLSDFGKALDNLVERTGLTILQSLVSTLKQSLQYGTPLADALRMIAAEMRAERQTKMEERAARLPVLLALPMMAFILPCLFMIIGTPVALRILDIFKNISFGAAP